MFITLSLLFKVINRDTEILENRDKKEKIIPNSILLTTATVFISLHFLLAFSFVHFFTQLCSGEKTTLCPFLIS